MLSPIEVSPTEPPFYKGLGDIVTARPERFGVDFLWEVNGDIWGVQRKKTKDFLASYTDGRLSKESFQIQEIAYPILIIEGTFTYNSQTGKLLERGQFANLSRTSIQKMIFSLQAKDGWSVVHAHDQNEFATLLSKLYFASESFELRASQRSGRRPGSGLERLLQFVDGVGPRKARMIARAYPEMFRLTVSREQLLALPDIGEHTVNQIFREFHG